MIKYLGSKAKLLDAISAIVAGLIEPGATVVDPFCGSGKVVKRFKEDGYKVIGSDMQMAPALLAKTILEYGPECQQQLNEAVARMKADVAPVEGYFTKTFCKDAMFFQPRNGALVDGYRDYIGQLGGVNTLLMASLLTSLDKVDNTCGVQMAYLKKWCKRAQNLLDVTPVQLVEGLPGLGMCKRWEDNKFLFDGSADLVYLDTPYNQHNYRGNYHIWETLVRWDAPETYGKAMKRVDCKTVKSDFNNKRKAPEAMKALIDAIKARYIVVSFSDEGFISRPHMEALLGARGEVTVHTRQHDRYVGARIGIHSTDGTKVGTVSHVKNKEYIYVCKLH